MKRFLALFISILIAITALCPVALAESAAAAGRARTWTTVIAGSDFQSQNQEWIEKGSDKYYYATEAAKVGQEILEKIMVQMKADNHTTIDGFMFGGDYSQQQRDQKTNKKPADGGEPTESEEFGASTVGKNAIQQSLTKVFGTVSNQDYILGNHENTVNWKTFGSTEPLTLHDRGAYYVFTIDYDNFPSVDADWGFKTAADAKAAVETTAAALNTALAEAVTKGAIGKKPVFVLSHTPLHYSTRTIRKADGLYAESLLSKLNYYANQGLNIIFMYGHNHSGPYDSYLGGSTNFVGKGETLWIANHTNQTYAPKPVALNFTYMNYGYVGPHGGNPATDNTQTMSLFQISEDDVVIRRYSAGGEYPLQAQAGKFYEGFNDQQYGYTVDDKIMASGEMVMGNDFKMTGTDGTAINPIALYTTTQISVDATTGTYSWVSDNPLVARVNSVSDNTRTALIAGTGVGTAKITVTCKETGATASYYVRVDKIQRESGSVFYQQADALVEGRNYIFATSNTEGEALAFGDNGYGGNTVESAANVWISQYNDAAPHILSSTHNPIVNQHLWKATSTVYDADAKVAYNELVIQAGSQTHLTIGSLQRDNNKIVYSGDNNKNVTVLTEGVGATNWADVYKKDTAASNRKFGRFTYSTTYGLLTQYAPEVNIGGKDYNERMMLKYNNGDGTWNVEMPSFYDKNSHKRVYAYEQTPLTYTLALSDNNGVLKDGKTSSMVVKTWANGHVEYFPVTSSMITNCPTADGTHTVEVKYGTEILSATYQLQIGSSETQKADGVDVQIPVTQGHYYRVTDTIEQTAGKQYLILNRNNVGNGSLLTSTTDGNTEQKAVSVVLDANGVPSVRDDDKAQTDDDSTINWRDEWRIGADNTFYQQRYDDESKVINKGKKTYLFGADADAKSAANITSSSCEDDAPYQSANKQYINNFNLGQTITFKDIRVEDGGTYKVSFRYAAVASGATYTLTCGSKSVSQSVTSTGGWTTWGSTSAVEINLEPGVHSITVKATGEGINFNCVEIIPTGTGAWQRGYLRTANNAATAVIVVGPNDSHNAIRGVFMGSPSTPILATGAYAYKTPTGVITNTGSKCYIEFDENEVGNNKNQKGRFDATTIGDERRIGQETYVFERVDYTYATATLRGTNGKVPVGADANTQTGTQIIITYPDGRVETIPVTLGMLKTASGGSVVTKNPCRYDSNSNSQLTVNYTNAAGTATLFENYTLTVYAEGEEDYPDYPEEGSVTINKSASTSDYNYNTTGVARVDLSASAVPTGKVDILIVVDTSSSTVKYKMDDGRTRLQAMRDAIAEMVDVLSNPNADGTSPDIKLAISEFHDYNYFSNVPTFHNNLFPTDTGHSYANVSGSGAPLDDKGQEILANHGIVQYYTDIEEMQGFDYTRLKDKAGTNYDIALQNAYEIVEQRQKENEVKGEKRDQIVVFMTDGMPYQYNYASHAGNFKEGTNWYKYLMGDLDDEAANTDWANNPVFKSNGYTVTNDGKGSDWLGGDRGTAYTTQANILAQYKFYHPEGKNWLAEAIKAAPGTSNHVIWNDTHRDGITNDGNSNNDGAGFNEGYVKKKAGLGATLYTVGFGVAEAEGEAAKKVADHVLKAIATDNDKYFLLDKSETELLLKTFREIADDLRHGATDAYFLDKIGDDFDLQMGAVINSNRTYEANMPTITVKGYDLYTYGDIGTLVGGNEVTADMVGTRKPTAPKTLETVSFSKDGKLVTSDKVANSSVLLNGFDKGGDYEIHNVGRSDINVDPTVRTQGTGAVEFPTTGDTKNGINFYIYGEQFSKISVSGVTHLALDIWLDKADAGLFDNITGSSFVNYKTSATQWTNRIVNSETVNSALKGLKAGWNTVYLPLNKALTVNDLAGVLISIGANDIAANKTLRVDNVRFVTNCLQDEVIYAKNFYFNTSKVNTKQIKLPNGTEIPLEPETFCWYIGELDETELVLSYYVYLEGAMGQVKNETAALEGIYDTNEYADLYYKNYLEKDCVQHTVTPTLPWKQAAVSYAFYLVDESGNIIVNQTTGETSTSFSQKIAVTNPVYQAFALNSSGGLTNSQVINAADVLPEGYTLYDTGASYQVYVTSSTTNVGGNWTIGQGTNVQSSTYVTGYGGDPSNTLKHSSTTDNFTNTTVWFAVTYKVGARPDTVVIDYGLPVSVDVLANDSFPLGGTIDKNLEYVPQEITSSNPLTVEFGQGTIDKGTEHHHVTTRIHTENLLAIEDCEKITLAAGYVAKCNVYDAAGNWLAASGKWQGSSNKVFEIPQSHMRGLHANAVDFKLVISAVTPEGGETPDITPDTFPADALVLTPVTKTTQSVKHGTATVMSQGKYIEYQLNDMKMDREEVYKYYVPYTNVTMTNGVQSSTTETYDSTLTVIPATNIYYESGRFIDFVPGMTKADANGSRTEVKWQTAGNVYDPYSQAQDRPGEFSFAALDANNVYGSDAVYKNSYTYSQNNSYYVTVNKNTDTSQSPTATFTFRGTGFDVFSVTSNDTGVVLVKVTDESGKVLSNTIVNTYYGYKYEDGKFVLDNNSDDALYQVPVISRRDMAYGTYTVELKPMYSSTFDKDDTHGYSIYVDSVRVYDPAGPGTKVNSEVVKDAYVADGEYAPQYAEVRDVLISKEKFYDATTDVSGYKNGSIFIDGRNEGFTVDDYTQYGPNNEVYLQQNQAIAFNLVVNGGDQPASVHLGMKTVLTTNNTPSNVVVMNTSQNGARTITVSGAHEMYYNIGGAVTWVKDGNTWKTSAPIVVANASDTILSITDLKWAYDSKTATPGAMDLTVAQADEQPVLLTLRRAVPMMSARPQAKLNGVIDGKLYIDDVLQTAYQVVEYDGDYYFVTDYNKVAVNTSFYLSNTFLAGTDLTAGYYTFDANGKMVATSGVVNGKLYVDGVMQKAYQVVELYGMYYFVTDYNKVAANTTFYLSDKFTAAVGLPAGYYTFDADGLMTATNGVVNGKLYVNGVMQKAYQVVEVNGATYFVSDYNKVATNCTLYLSKSLLKGTELAPGYYTFDAEGKMN